MTTTKPDKQEGGISKIVRNASYMMGSQLATWAMTLTTIFLIPRYLGAEAFGEFSSAESIWLIGGAVTLFGLDTLLTKSIAREPEKVSSYFSTAIVNVVFNYTLTFGGILLFAWLSGYSPLRIQLIAMVGIGSFAMSILNLAQSCLTGLEQMGYVSSVATINRAIFTVLALTALFMGGNLFAIVIVTIAVSILGAIFMVGALYKAHPFKLIYDYNLSKQLFIDGSPYFLTLIFAKLYKEFDMVMMTSLLPDAAELGYYSVADRLFGTLMFLPNALITALFPVLARMHSEESDLLPNYISKSFNILFLIGVPVGLGISAISGPIILLLFGEGYTDAAKILQILGFVLILTYQTILLGNFLISVDKQRAWTITMAVAAFATIPLDLVLVPYAQTFGPAGVGGALAYIFTEGGMVIAGLYLLPRGYINWGNAVFVIKAALAGGVMYAAVLFMNQYGLVPAVAAGAIVYPATIWLLRTIPDEDMTLIKSMAAPITNKLGRFKK